MSHRYLGANEQKGMEYFMSPSKNNHDVLVSPSSLWLWEQCLKGKINERDSFCTSIGSMSCIHQCTLTCNVQSLSRNTKSYPEIYLGKKYVGHIYMITYPEILKLRFHENKVVLDASSYVNFCTQKMLLQSLWLIESVSVRDGIASKKLAALKNDTKCISDLSGLGFFTTAFAICLQPISWIKTFSARLHSTVLIVHWV